VKKLMERLEKLLAWGGVKRDIAFLVLSALSLVLSFFLPDILPFNPAWIAIVLCGLPIILQALIGLITEFDIKADVLVSLALIAAVIIGEDFAAGEVAVIMQLGALLEEVTVARARAGIERLVALSPRTARILQDGQETVVPAERVQVGDSVRVLPGETVPVDGVIIAGQTSIDESVMTGESLPVDKECGSKVCSGTVNQFGAFTMKAEHVGQDSSLQRMIALVQSADAGKAKIVRLADRWATWIVVIALVSAGLTWLVSGEAIRAVTILVVFCPCALVLATPTAIVAAIGNATRFGILVRQGDALERLAGVHRICFDKTGTLTQGRPEVVAVKSFGMATSFELYDLVASAESLSEHPLGKAVVRGWHAAVDEAVEREAAGRATLKGKREAVEREAREREAFKWKAAGAPTEFSMLPGRGIRARVEGRAVLAGNLAMMHEAHILLSDAAKTCESAYFEQGCTLIYVAVDGELAGCIALADTLRPTAGSTVRALRTLGIEPVLLTGDSSEAAYHIASELGIDEVQAGCLPESKLNTIRQFEQEGSPVCMVGDGINDAPALKQATVGIALGGVGSDIAVDAADIALVKDDLAALPHLIALSKRMMATIKLNMGFSMALNFAAIVLAMVAVLDPVTGALVHNVGSVVVIGNSALLLRWKSRSRD
jgi:heavy metal translocating P-type ATPase